MGNEVEEIKNRLDIVEIIGSYLTLKKAGQYFKAPCPFHHEKTPSFMVSSERQSFKCFGCFPAGQLIDTKDGFKEVQDIKKGELVYTSLGRLKPVDILFEREYKGDLLEITPRMIAMPVKITGDHKVFAIRTEHCRQEGRKSRICQKNCRQRCPTKYFENYKVEKIQARELNEKDLLLYPVKNFSDHFVDEIDLAKYLVTEKKRGIAPKSFKRSKIMIDVNFARLAGLYIAEGSGHRAYIRFSFGNHEEHLAREVVSLIKEIFDLNSSVHLRQNGKSGIEVTCCSSKLSQIFEKMFGKGAANKKIPSFLLNQRDDIREILVGAILEGDGTVTKDQKKGVGGRKSITTISFELIHQIKDILISFGQRPSLCRGKGYISSAGIKHRNSYRINWRENDKTHFSDFVELNGVRYWLLPIRKIFREEFSGLVYNLNVREDHSYLTQSFCVANCGEGGDIFTFIEKMEGIDFYNALKILADKSGIRLQNNSVSYGQKEYKSDKKTRIFEINDWAKKLFHKILLDHPKADKAREYLNYRGINDATTAKFELGYAPASWDLLIKFLEGKGYKREEMVQAGLAIKNEKGDIYDRFRGRIMFPINNIMGLTVAFTSRVINDDDPKAAKYMNSAESPIYIKGKTIYGLDKAKVAIKEADMAVFVEGNMDVIACHQAGFTNVVATSGTAITEDQLKILSRYAGEIAFSFDSDAAGEAAMKKAVGLALKNDIATKIISLPAPFKDPDEAIKSDPKNWKKAVDESKPSLEHWVDLLVRKNPDLGILTKKKIAKEILPVIKTIYSEIEKEYYIKYLSKRLFVSEKSLINTLEKSKENPEFAKKIPKEELKSIKLDITEKILGLLWLNPGLLALAKNDLSEFTGPEIVSSFVEMVRNKEIDKNSISPNGASVLNQYAMAVTGELGSNDEEILKKEFFFYVNRLRREKTDRLKSEYAKKIQLAEESGDKEKLKLLLSEFQNLIK